MAENLVIVRAFGKKPLIRAVLEHQSGGVLVCMPSNFDAIRRGELPEPMLGFPQKDVFAYDAKTAKAIEKGQPIDWARLKQIEAAN